MFDVSKIERKRTGGVVSWKLRPTRNFFRKDKTLFIILQSFYEQVREQPFTALRSLFTGLGEVGEWLKPTVC